MFEKELKACGKQFGFILLMLSIGTTACSSQQPSGESNVTEPQISEAEGQPQPSPAPAVESPISPVVEEPKAPLEPQLASNQLRVSKQEFGNEWPFTVDEGILACYGSGGVGEVVFTANGINYAVNGIASSKGNYRPKEEVWEDNPSLPGTKKSVGTMISRGLELCP